MKAGIIQLVLILVFYLISFPGRADSLEGKQGITILISFTFMIAATANIIGTIAGIIFLKKINLNLSFYALILVVPLLLFGVFANILNAQEEFITIIGGVGIIAFLISQSILFLITVRKQ